MYKCWGGVPGVQSNQPKLPGTFYTTNWKRSRLISIVNEEYSPRGVVSSAQAMWVYQGKGSVLRYHGFFGGRKEDLLGKRSIVSPRCNRCNQLEPTTAARSLHTYLDSAAEKQYDLKAPLYLTKSCAQPSASQY